MAEVEILDVVPGELSPQFFWGGSIDSPVKGKIHNHYALVVNGWLLHRDVEQYTVVATSEGQPIATWPGNRERPDVADWFSQPVTPFCGFEGVIRTSILPQRFEVRIEAGDANPRTLLGTIYGRRSALTSPHEDAMQPALVTTLGRTGSTLLMLLLGQHPQLIVHPPFPFETRVASYWSSVFEGLSSPGSYLQSMAAIAERRFWWVGHADFPSQTYMNQDAAAQWLGGQGVDNLASFARRQIVDFYEASAAYQGRLERPRYFAEKEVPNPILREIQRAIFPGRGEIFLVRDFRDMLVSILAFNAKRGYHSFGNRWHDENQYVAELGLAVKSLLYSWKTASKNALLVRYEDLVQQPQSTLQQILRFLELRASDTLVNEMIRNVETVEPRAQQQHRTSADSLSSIGRWNQELPKELRETSHREFAEALTVFGYEAGPG